MKLFTASLGFLKALRWQLNELEERNHLGQRCQFIWSEHSNEKRGFHLAFSDEERRLLQCSRN